MIKNRSMSYIKKSEINSLVINEEEIEKPNSHQVQVHVHRAGVSMGDVIEGSNTVKKINKFPWTPGYDFAGIVISIGDKVKDIYVGQRVTGYCPAGCYRKVINTSEEYLVSIPKNVDYDTAVAININYTTAYRMMKDEVGLSKDNIVLVHSAAGGIGSATLDLAKLWGIKIYGTASSKKQEFISSFGAIPIDYTTKDFVEELRCHEPEGVDVVFETIGMDNALKSRKTLKKSGVLILSGSIELTSKKESLFSFVLKTLKVLLFNQGIRTKLFIADPSSKKGNYIKNLTTLLNYANKGLINPVIYKTLLLEEANNAQKMLLSGEVMGKIVLNCE